MTLTHNSSHITITPSLLWKGYHVGIHLNLCDGATVYANTPFGVEPITLYGGGSELRITRAAWEDMLCDLSVLWPHGEAVDHDLAERIRFFLLGAPAVTNDIQELSFKL